MQHNTLGSVAARFCLICLLVIFSVKSHKHKYCWMEMEEQKTQAVLDVVVGTELL